jgi:hypothetical protein
MAINDSKLNTIIDLLETQILKTTLNNFKKNRSKITGTEFWPSLDIPVSRDVKRP